MFASIEQNQKPFTTSSLEPKQQSQIINSEQNKMSTDISPSSQPQINERGVNRNVPVAMALCKQTKPDFPLKTFLKHIVFNTHPEKGQSCSSNAPEQSHTYFIYLGQHWPTPSPALSEEFNQCVAELHQHSHGNKDSSPPCLG